MPVDTKFIGREYKPITYVVGQEKIKEYALAIGDLNPLYIDPGFAKKSKYGTVIAPPMFVVVFTRDAMFSLFEDNEIKIDFARLVHGEQEFNFHKIVKANDSIKTTSKIKNIYQKNNNDFIKFETKSYNQDSELVVEGFWTFIVRGK
ncbi:MAG: MaoC family dehydratase N-terminal domain-containing protein [Candidatus Melainabacteria bacterium]|nr:MaoC family dehydratase N-terminal domain-containing protein [Candidatus Melainabacteria bacterium]